MIYQIPEQSDPLKDSIEKIKKEIEKEKLPPEDIFKQQEKFKKLGEESLPKLESEIKELIENIKTDILSSNPQGVLDYFALVYGLTTTKKITEDLNSLNNSYLDYILSFITSLKSESFDSDNTCPEKTLECLQSNIEKLHQNVIYYFMITSVDKNKTPDEMRFLQSLNHIIVKGDSYSEHKIQLCKEHFLKYDELLIKNYDVCSGQLIDGLIGITNSPLSNMEVQKKYMAEMKKAHNIFKKESDKAKKKGRLKSFLEDFKSSESMQKTREKLKEIEKETKIKFHDSVFKLHTLPLPKQLLDEISLNIGDNDIFQNGKLEYFPMNDSLIYDKPLTKIDDEYFCFNSPAMQYNLDSIIENLILNLIPANKQSKQYYSKKGDYLEDKSLELFQSILPNSEAYINLKYGVDDEVDGLIIYDNNIFIIEAKSNKFVLGAKKGNTDKIKRNTKDIIEKAYQQAIRAKNYIESNEVSEFRDKKTKKVLLQIDKSKINNIYMINTTLEPLMHITANLNSLERFGFVQGEDWIWSVYLNDLRIIAEIIESPTEFLLYLERRIKFNDYPQIKTMEEIDIFGYFLNNGLYFEDIDFPKEHYMMTLSGFSQPIDEYYLYKEGKINKSIKKPSYFKKCRTNKIVQKLETSNQDKSSIIAKMLLSYDEQHQNEIEEQFINILKKKRKNFSMFLTDENIGFTVIHNHYENKNDMDFYCKTLSYENKINNWFLITLDGTNINNIDVNFKYMYFDNKFDETLENEVKSLKERRLKQMKNLQKDIDQDKQSIGSSNKILKRKKHLKKRK